MYWDTDQSTVCVFPRLNIKIWKFYLIKLFFFCFVFFTMTAKMTCGNKFQPSVCVRVDGRGCDKQQAHRMTVTREAETIVEQTIKQVI